MNRAHVVALSKASATALEFANRHRLHRMLSYSDTLKHGLLGLACLALAVTALAHSTSTGLATLQVQGHTLAYRLTVSPAELGEQAAAPLVRAAAGDATAARQVADALQQQLQLAVNDQPCRLQRTRLQASAGNDGQAADRIVVMLDLQCPAEPGSLLITDRLHRLLGEHYRTITSVVREGRAVDANATAAAMAATAGSGATGTASTASTASTTSTTPAAGRRQEHIFDKDHEQVRMDFGVAAPSTLWGFVRLGGEHILGGADHLLFLAALLLASSRLRALLITVTAFTLAHSVSLAAATLGWVHVDPRWVEPVIALSIVWVALETVFASNRPERANAGEWRRHALTFVFGLVHGLAFSEALSELQLSGWGLGRALLGFNLGVEAAQALVVLLLAPMLLALRRTAAAPHVRRVLALGISLMGLVWLVQRVGA